MPAIRQLSRTAPRGLNPLFMVPTKQLPWPMAVRNFDRKFGAEFLESLPGSPGVYLVYDEQDELIYIRRAKNLKQRLSQYCSTLRRKKLRRIRGIVQEAARIEIPCAES